MPIPMPEQNAEKHRGFHGRFGIQCNRFCRQVQARLESIIDDAFADFVKPGLSAGIVESWGLALHESFARDVVVEAQKKFTSNWLRVFPAV
jgi:hypothetical protein